MRSEGPPVIFFFKAIQRPMKFHMNFRMGFGIRCFEFAYWLFLILVILFWDRPLKLFESHFQSLWSGDCNKIYPMEDLWWLNERTHVKCVTVAESVLSYSCLYYCFREYRVYSIEYRHTQKGPFQLNVIVILNTWA